MQAFINNKIFFLLLQNLFLDEQQFQLKDNSGFAWMFITQKAISAKKYVQ
jgi:uncharacterized glyoxalase superfamily protein PhnB